MKIREGAYYRARGGQVFGPMVPGGTPASDYVWCLDPLIQGYNWDSEGSWRKGWDGPLDLISEVYVSDTPPMLITVRTGSSGGGGGMTPDMPRVGFDPPDQRQTADAPAPEAKTLRDEFAFEAMKKLMDTSGLKAAAHHEEANRTGLAKLAYGIADAMMEARRK